MKAVIDNLNTKWWFKLSLGVWIYVMGPVQCFLFGIPLLLLRLLAMATAPIFRPHVAKIISPESGLTSLDDYWGEPKHAVVGLHYTARPVSRQTVLDTMNQVLSRGKFPELEQKLERWLGLYFWSQCPEFTLSRHVNSCDSVVTLQDVQIEQDRLCRKPFLKNAPLWDITLFPNFRDDKGTVGVCGGAVALRVHHVLADGVAHVSLLSAIAGKDPPPQKKLTFLQNLKAWILYFATINRIYLTHQYTLAIAFLVDFNFNAWIKPKPLRSRQLSFYESNELELATLKKAAKSSGHTATEVLMAALATALRKDMQDNGEPVPLSMSAIYPFPKPGHPGTLTNCTYLSSLVLPVGIHDRTQQLRELRADFALKRWSAPLLNSAITLFGVFIQLSKWMPNIGPYCSLAVTNFALSQKPWNLFGEEVLRSSFVFDVAEHVPVIAMFVGYREYMNIWVKGRKDVWPDERRPRKIVQNIIQDVTEMAKLG